MDFTVGMSLVDFIPVIFFAVGSVFLQRDLYNKMSKGAFALFAAGTINVVLAGGLKALYKLLYAVGLCDFRALSTLFFPLQSIGFLLAGIAVIAMLVHEQGNTKVCSVAAAPVLFSGTFVFVGCMVAGLFCIDLGLCIVSKKMKKGGYIAIFIVSFICSLCMGYLASKDFSKAIFNWIAEGINIVGQGTFCLGAWLLHKNGLAEVELKE